MPMEINDTRFSALVMAACGLLLAADGSTSIAMFYVVGLDFAITSQVSRTRRDSIRPSETLRQPSAASLQPLVSDNLKT